MDAWNTRPPLCGRCKVDVVLSDDMVRCPRCGQTDTLDDACREAAQHTAHKILSAVLRDSRTNDRPELYFRFVESGDVEPWLTATPRRGVTRGGAGR